MRIRVYLTAFAMLALVGCSASSPATSSTAPNATIAPGSFSIDQPAQGATVSQSHVDVSGRASPGSRIVRDISFAPDEEATAAADGAWTMSVELGEGSNDLVFRVGDDHSTEIHLRLTLLAISTGSPAPLPSIEPAPTATVKPQPTPAPTATPVPPPTFLTFGDGTFQVGTDVKPGTYRLRDAPLFCYWARLKGFDGTLGEIIANENLSDAFGVVTIKASDVGFESTGCDEWSSDLSQITSSKTHIDTDGTYIVGTDLAAGKWKSSGGDYCYWARLSGFSGTLSSIIANNNVLGGSTIVTIRSTDKGFTATGCGTWTRI
jgi:hypothetical protein